MTTRRSTESAYNSEVPELPDVLLYLHALRPRIVGHVVQKVRLASPFLLRSIDPPLTAVEGRTIVELHRLGKRIVFEAEGEVFLVFHLMIAGRFRWKPHGTLSCPELRNEPRVTVGCPPPNRRRMTVALRRSRFSSRNGPRPLRKHRCPCHL